MSSSSRQPPSLGSVSDNLFLSLKFRETRRDGYNQVKILLCRTNLSVAESASPDLHNSIAYVMSHTKAFSKLEAFTLIDLGLANVSIPEKEKIKFLGLSRLAISMPKRMNSGLCLNENLKGLATRQGTYMRLLDLLVSGKSLEGFKSDIFNALRNVVSQTTVLTKEQMCKVVDCAFDHETFSRKQKEHFRTWKEDRTEVHTRRTTNVVNGFATNACQQLMDRNTGNVDYTRVIEILCKLKPLNTSKSDLLEAVLTIASGSHSFSEEQCRWLTDCALQSDLLAEYEKKIIRARSEDRVGAGVRVLGRSNSRCVDAKPIYSNISTGSREGCSLRLFVDLTSP